MRLKLHRKKALIALVFTLSLVAIGSYTLTPPDTNHSFFVQFRSSASSQLIITGATQDTSGDTLLTQHLDSGNTVVEFQSQDLSRLTFKAIGSGVGDSVVLASMVYQRADRLAIFSTAQDLQQLCTHDGRCESTDFNIAGAQVAPPLELSLEHVLVSNASIYIHRFFFFILASAIGVIVLYWLVPAVDRLANISLLQLMGCSLLFGLGFYAAFTALSDFPNRTVVEVTWAKPPQSEYGIQTTSKNSFADADTNAIDPRDLNAPPKHLMAERHPIQNLRLHFENGTSAYHIQALRVFNVFRNISLEEEQLAEAFPLLNNVRVEYSPDAGNSISMVPTGTHPFIMWVSDHLPFYRKVDRLVFHIAWFLSWLVMLIVFVLLVNVAFRKMVSPIAISWFPVAFALIIILPGLLWLFSSPTPFLSAEKRKTTNLKEMDTLAVSEITSRIERYLSDHFGARSTMIEADNIINQLTLQQGQQEAKATQQGPVAFGKEDWLFYAGEDLKENIRNTQPIDALTLNLIRQNLLELDAWFRSKGTTFFLAFPPMKHSIYEEYLPEALQPINRPSRLTMITNHLRATTNLKIIDLHTTLMEAKEKEDRLIYYKRDSHWNQLGAFYAYQTIIDTLNNYFAQIGPPRTLSDYSIVRTENNQADLASLLGLQDQLLRDELLVLPKDTCNCVQTLTAELPIMQPKAPTINYLNRTNDNNLSIYVFRDSYSNYLIPSFNFHFQKSTYVWTHMFHPSAVKNEYPDIVLYEVMERFASTLIVPNTQEVTVHYNSSFSITDSTDIP